MDAKLSMQGFTQMIYCYYPLLDNLVSQQLEIQNMLMLFGEFRKKQYK